MMQTKENCLSKWTFSSRTLSKRRRHEQWPLQFHSSNCKTVRVCQSLYHWRRGYRWCACILQAGGNERLPSGASSGCWLLNLLASLNTEEKTQKKKHSNGQSNNNNKVTVNKQKQNNKSTTTTKIQNNNRTRRIETDKNCLAYYHCQTHRHKPSLTPI